MTKEDHPHKDGEQWPKDYHDEQWLELPELRKFQDKEIPVIFDHSLRPIGRVRVDMASIMQGALSQSEEDLARMRIAFRIMLASRAKWRKKFFYACCIIAGFLVVDLWRLL